VHVGLALRQLRADSIPIAPPPERRFSATGSLTYRPRATRRAIACQLRAAAARLKTLCTMHRSQLGVEAQRRTPIDARVRGTSGRAKSLHSFYAIGRLGGVRSSRVNSSSRWSASIVSCALPAESCWSISSAHTRETRHLRPISITWRRASAIRKPTWPRLCVRAHRRHLVVTRPPKLC